MADPIYYFIFRTGGLRTMENSGEGCKKGLGKARGRGEKDCRNPGDGVISGNHKLEKKYEKTGPHREMYHFNGHLDRAQIVIADIENATVSPITLWSILLRSPYQIGHQRCNHNTSKDRKFLTYMVINENTVTTSQACPSLLEFTFINTDQSSPLRE
jgi:hypothetical protein